MSHTWVEISHSAIRHNFEQFSNLLGKNIALCPVIKSNAYGHGAQEVADILGARASFLAFANVKEALALKKGKQTLIALSYFEDEDIEPAIRHGIRLPVYSFQAAKKISTVAVKLKKKANVHFKIDTGATRVGLRVDNAVSEILRIIKLPGLQCEGVYSHFATADDGKAYMIFQDREFQRIVNTLESKNIFFTYRHIACTGAILQKHSEEYNIARLGIGLYGLWPSAKLQKQSRLKLRPALTWKTKIVDIKKISAGISVGYGRSFIAKRPTTVAVLPIGYWEGYDRHVSNAGEVLVGGTVCPVIGRVCMNLTMIDITRIPKAHVGTEVTLLSDHQSVSADSLAKKIGTINYEVVTRINPLIPRIVVS